MTDTAEATELVREIPKSAETLINVCERHYAILQRYGLEREASWNDLSAGIIEFIDVNLRINHVLLERNRELLKQIDRTRELLKQMEPPSTQ